MHFGNPPAENPKAADGDAMLHNSPTAELEMKSPTATAVPLTLAHYSSTVVAGLLFDALPNFVPLAGCYISGLTVFIVSRGKARRRNGVHALPWLIALCSSGVSPSKASSLVVNDAATSAGAKGKSVPNRMWPVSAKAFRLGNDAGLDDSAVSK